MRTVVWLLAVLAALSHAPGALGHASLVRSDPPDRAVVARAPSTLTLTFNEPVSPISLKLVGDGGHALELRSIVARDEALIVTLPGALPEGTHLLSWRVMSADGHPVGGSLTFSVGRPSVATASVFESNPTAIVMLWLVRFAIYAGLFAGVGGAVYAAFISQGSLGTRVERLLRAMLEGGLIATIISVGLQGVDVLGEPLSAIRRPSVWASGIASPYGVTAALIVASLLAAYFSLSANRQRPLALLSLFTLGAALAASGHASAAAPQWLTRPAVFIHGVSVAWWAGALIPLANALRDRRMHELARFSRWIPLPFAALVVSGGALAVIQLQQLTAIWNTNYGRILCAKLAVVAALMALAAANRWSTRGALLDDRQAIRTITTTTWIEVVLAAVVLALVASWRFTPPPRSLLVAASQPVHAHIHTERAMADLQIDPEDAAGRRVAITLLDGEFRPLVAKEVTVVFFRSDAGIEPLRFVATHVVATLAAGLFGCRAQYRGLFHHATAPWQRLRFRCALSTFFGKFA